MSNEPEETKLVDTYILAAAPTDADKLNVGVQKGSDAKDSSGTILCKSSHFISSPKTTFIQHGLNICFVNQNILLFIIKCLPTNVIKVPRTIWRCYQVQGCVFVIIR